VGTALTPERCCDGVFTDASVAGQHVWQTSALAGYLYFKIPASIGATAGEPLYVAVQYYDDGYTNRLGYQYDGSVAFATPEVTAHSSFSNSLTFQTGYFAMIAPSLQKRENGGNDFRIFGMNGPLSVASVRISKTPFPDGTFQFALTKPWLDRFPAPSTDATTLKGRTVAGYQGWFSCPNDVNDQGWVHWSETVPFSVPTIPTWPDVSFYPADSSVAGARCQADQVRTASGQQAYVYSSSNPDVVERHFAWMKQYDIDGIFLQRFLGGGNVPGRRPEWVLGNVRKSAWVNGRIWAIEYDVSQLTILNDAATIEADWKWLNDAARIRGDGNYARNGGKPVVAIWGLACRAGYTPQTADTLLDFFKNDPNYGGNYVIGGICNQFRNMTDWTAHFRRYDGLLVWQPQVNGADRALFASWGVDWYPHVWAGHHEGGQEYWNNTYDVVANGADRYFIGMFDEYGEDTAIIPTSDDPPAFNPPMLTNEGKPATWWLQLSGYGRKMMLRQIPLSRTMPTPG